MAQALWRRAGDGSACLLYTSLRFNPAARICVFAGPNGAGKTNLLEAASLLVPGRGLRGAKFSELARRGPDATATWAVAAQLSGAEGTFEIGTGTAENAPCLLYTSSP